MTNMYLCLRLFLITFLKTWGLHSIAHVPIDCLAIDQVVISVQSNHLPSNQLMSFLSMSSTEQNSSSSFVLCKSSTLISHETERHESKTKIKVEEIMDLLDKLVVPWQWTDFAFPWLPVDPQAQFQECTFVLLNQYHWNVKPVKCHPTYFPVCGLWNSLKLNQIKNSWTELCTLGYLKCYYWKFFLLCIVCYYNKVPIYHIMFSLLFCEGIILVLLERDCVN